MEQNEINTILDSFFISQEELQSRLVLNEFVQSLSSIIVDEFAKDYLLNNPYLSVYLAHTDGSMLLKKIKNFIAFILVAPVDTTYVKRIHEIGFIHHAIKLEPAKLSYGFWAINEVLNKLAKTNPLVKEHKSLISKLLKFVEHMMNNGYYLKQERIRQESVDDFKTINAQNELYIGFNIHKLNAKKVSLAISDTNNLPLLDDIEEDSSLCSFGKILQELQGNKKYEYILGTSYQKINQIHEQWHLEFRAIKNALEKKDEKNLKEHNQKIELLTQELSSILNISLAGSLKDGHLSLRSGMKAMKKMTKLFYDKDYKNLESYEVTDLIYTAINKTILSEFSWSIQNLKITHKDIEKNGLLFINKSFRYKAQNVYISIELKYAQDTSYLHEIISLLLEVMELHFFVQERELSLIKFADEAENANKSKDMFLANMSHELRTPINAITGFSQILMMKKDTPETIKKYIQRINIAGNNLLDLVNTILDFAKLESGKMQFNPSLSNISDIFSEVKTLMTPLAKNKNIKLTMPNIVSLNLYIDKGLFKQVLINLLSNAVKFTHKEGEISLSVLYNEKSGAYTFEIKDNGIGIDKQEISKLFQAFSQIDNSYQKKYKGSGLGLMISKNIIEDLHKGKIWVKSVKDEGSSFFIEMPTPMLESNTYIVNNAPTDAKHILIVEDSKEYQKILISNLEPTHKLTLTDTINKAKELISHNNYDFLILDFFLTDGISSEILQFMKSENISISAIIISAEDQIHISSSLSKDTNLKSIVNKKDIHEICSFVRQLAF